MFYAVRTTTAQPGKAFQLAAWANELDAYLSRVLGRPVKHLMSAGGTVGRVGWILEFESMAQYEQAVGKLLQDREFQGLAQRTEGLTVPGSTHDDYWVGR